MNAREMASELREMLIVSAEDSDLIPALNEYLKDTPAKKAGIKEGDLVLADSPRTMMGVAVLELDDGGAAPLFRLITGTCEYRNSSGDRYGAYVHLDNVKKITEPVVYQSDKNVEVV